MSAEQLLNQCKQQMELQAQKEASGEVPVGPKHDR